MSKAEVPKIVILFLGVCVSPQPLLFCIFCFYCFIVCGVGDIIKRKSRSVDMQYRTPHCGCFIRKEGD